ncbi:MAG TPA: xanthine dehydrogenase family protein molybdopterin-binding subunit [Alphaproteobacteria bacterium]|nr:xanthine dehydrogenase family protein molybdopterin-binding subunit [Alphaproteobacteria bacterium]
MAGAKAGARPQYKGRSLPRAAAARLVAGRGRYTDDIAPARLVHATFVRSPHAHAAIGAIDTATARAAPGVVGVFTAAELASVCQPFETKWANLPQHRSPPQSPLAGDRARWQGEPVVAVVARTRAEAEDAGELVEIDYDPLPAVSDPDAALGPGTSLVHTGLGDNLAFEMTIGRDGIDKTFADAATVVEAPFQFGRITAVSLEPRSIIADFNPAEGSLTIHQAHQAPHLMQELYARHLDLPAHKVRVIAPDVGGAFGIKLHAYPDDFAVAAIARLLGRPVKHICDRLDAFQSDAHAREVRLDARLAVDGDGRLIAMDADIRVAAGAYSIYPRSSLGEGLQALTLNGGPYRLPALGGRLRVAYQNKVPTGVYRAVGQPIACAATEVLLDEAAHRLGIDPVEIRRRNYLGAADLPMTTPGGLRVEALSLEGCLDKLLALMDYETLRAEQASCRERGVHRGIGLATFLEQTAVGPGLYGPSGLPVGSQDGCTIKLEPSGALRCEVGATDQGQGTMAGITQVVADAFGLDPDNVSVASGDSAGPYGGGAWASRGLAISGEAAHLAACDLRGQVLAIAGAVLQAKPEALDLRDGVIVDAGDGRARMTLVELCEIAFYRSHELPPDIKPELVATRHFTNREPPYFVANGIQASYLEVDVETGGITLLGHWAVEDCGRLVNPMLVDEQMRGGIVQGLGAALFENCIYSEEGQLLTGTMVDYLVPMAAELPDIAVAHLETPQAGTELGVKGAGEAGAVGSGAAVWCALNDALRPLGARVTRQPFTPETVLKALSRGL